MGYCIKYGAGKGGTSAVPSNSRRLWAMTGAFFLLFLILTHVFWPSGVETMRGILLPGDPAAVEAAFTRMSDSLEQGDSLGEAVTAFCQEIVIRGEVSD